MGKPQRTVRRQSPFRDSLDGERDGNHDVHRDETQTRTPTVITAESLVFGKPRAHGSHVHTHTRDHTVPPALVSSASSTSDAHSAVLSTPSPELLASSTPASTVSLKPSSTSLPATTAALTQECQAFASFLSDVKRDCEIVESRADNGKVVLQYVLAQRTAFIQTSIRHFERIWRYLSTSQDTPHYEIHKQLVRSVLEPYLLRSEINHHIVSKPFGYAGDFQAIEYLYSGHDSVMGKTAYDKLVNDLTASIPIAESTTLRKQYFKRVLTEKFQSGRPLTILSVGSGTACELIEALSEQPVTTNIQFTCLDFDERPLNIVQDRLRHIPLTHRKGIHIRFSALDIKQLLHIDRAKKLLGTFDFIYSAGLFDYFNDRFCSKVSALLFRLLNPKSTLILCNVNTEFSAHRVYYEAVGDWLFFHRSETDMAVFTRHLPPNTRHAFESFDRKMSHWFLKIYS